MSEQSAAELSGMVTDEVISIGGSYVFDEWIANPSAEYTHVRYKNDAINVLDSLGKRRLIIRMCLIRRTLIHMLIMMDSMVTCALSKVMKQTGLASTGLCRKSSTEQGVKSNAA